MSVAQLPDIVRGDTYPISIDVSAAFSGSIEGHTFTFTMKADPTAATIDLQEVLVVGAGAEADAGRTILELPRAKTGLLTVGAEMHFDLQWNRPAAEQGGADSTTTLLVTGKNGNQAPLFVLRDMTLVDTPTP